MVHIITNTELSSLVGIRQWGITNDTPANNGGRITFTYPISFGLVANPILSETMGTKAGASGPTQEACCIESANLISCVIYSEWYMPVEQTYRLIVIGK